MHQMSTMRKSSAMTLHFQMMRLKRNTSELGKKKGCQRSRRLRVRQLENRVLQGYLRKNLPNQDPTQIGHMDSPSRLSLLRIHRPSVTMTMATMACTSLLQDQT